jgi:UDP-GlcNAc:undecaprenyl-phosphate GlcNAc-1-phosphate transferase
VALRYVPYHHHNPAYFRVGWTIVMGAIVLIALAASVYLVYVLEILKFKSRRSSEIRQAEPSTSEHDIEERVRRDVETGEFERVG